MTPQLVSVIVFWTAIAWLAPRSHAEVVLRFSDDGGASFDDQFQANVNDMMTIGVYAFESVNESRLSTLGLYNVGTLGTFDPALGTVVGKRPNPGLALFFPADPANDVVGTVELSGIASDFLTPVTGSSILVGEFDYRVTQVGVNQFDFGDLSGIDDFEVGPPSSLIGLDRELFSVDPINLPVDRSRKYGFQVAAVPEPNMVVILFCGLCTCWAIRRRHH